jgi:Na+-transporting NADH:ubiquinone oxidoreductase subunit NqrB
VERSQGGNVLLGRSGWNSWGFSVMISALSICLLLKTNHWYTSLFATFLTVSCKFIFRFRKKHLFNPSAFGIVATLLITRDAWLSPGQWGSNAVLFFLIVVLGTIVVTRVQKLDSSLAFLLTFAGLLCWRQLYVLGWPLDHFMHSVTTGSLLLFSFFMISDPKTSPNRPLARIIWAMTIAVIAFYLAAFKWIYNTPIWVLVAAAPIVPLLDKIFLSRPFEWSSSIIHANIISKLKKNNHEIV